MPKKQLERFNNQFEQSSMLQHSKLPIVLHQKQASSVSTNIVNQLNKAGILACLTKNALKILSEEMLLPTSCSRSMNRFYHICYSLIIRSTCSLFSEVIYRKCLRGMFFQCAFDNDFLTMLFLWKKAYHNGISRIEGHHGRLLHVT